TNGIAGVSAGLIGMALSGFMLKHFNTVFETDIHPEMQFAVYRAYFKTTLFIFIPGLIVLLSLKPLPKERRWRSWIFSSHYR
ncbi:MAG: hypothetical protein FWG05_03435, partial [Kiritimatiellaeota bacterium]|nr:hypothetical protein [Kiritimatiellota bacterium]